VAYYKMHFSVQITFWVTALTVATLLKGRL